MLQPERPTAELELTGDAVVVVAYGLLIPESLLESGLWLNVHPSLLPRWRGAAPVQRSIMAGDEITGATVFSLVEALDAGPVLGTITERILEEEARAQAAAEREAALRRQLDQLRIELDAQRQAERVGEVTETEYFGGLRAQASDLRRIIGEGPR